MQNRGQSQQSFSERENCSSSCGVSQCPPPPPASPHRQHPEVSITWADQPAIVTFLFGSNGPRKSSFSFFKSSLILLHSALHQGSIDQAIPHSNQGRLSFLFIYIFSILNYILLITFSPLPFSPLMPPTHPQSPHRADFLEA